MFFSFLIYLGKFLLFTALSEALRPKNQARNPAGTLKDISFPTADPTRPIQWLIGRRLIDNVNLFATFDFRGVERSRRVKTGLFSRDNIPLPPEYYISTGLVLCGGAGVRLKEIWVGERLAWSGDVGSGSSIPLNVRWTEDGQPDAPRGISGTLDFHSGDTTPSPYLEAKRGAGNVPAWPHLTYAVLRGATSGGAWIGTSRQVEHLKFVVERMPTAASTGLGPTPDSVHYWSVDGDANPAYAAAEILTDRHYGAGIDPALIDAASFHAAAQVLHAENHGTSQLWDSQRLAGEVVLELCRQAGMILQPDPVTGLHTLRVLRATDAPVIVLNDSNIKRIDEFSRSAMDESTNAMSIQYTSKSENWAQRPVEVQDLGAIEVAGQVISGTASYAGITNRALASTLALRDLRAVSSPLATARVSAIVAKRQRFMPGDAVLFSSAKHGVARLRMRVTSARYARPGEALCELELVEDVFRAGEAIYGEPSEVTVLNNTNGISFPKQIVQQDLFPAPYALSRSDSEHGMYYAIAPSADTTGYELGWFSTSSNDIPEYHSRAPIGFAAMGTLAATLPEIHTPGSIVINVTAANAATLARFESRPAYCIVGEEMMRITGVYLNVARTQATLTGITRAIWDTIPARIPGGTDFVVLCDFVIDVAPTASSVRVEGEVDPVKELEGQNSLSALAWGRNARGVAAPGPRRYYYNGYFGELSSRNIRSRSILPYTPGNVKLEGIYGSDRSHEAPNVIANDGCVTATWAVRNKLDSGLLPWASENSPDEEPAGGDGTVAILEYHDGSRWHVCPLAPGSLRTNTEATFTVPSSTAGLVKLTVFSSTLKYGAVLRSLRQVWYFNLTA